MTLLIREETPADVARIREVNLLAFGSPVEADLVEAIRESGYASLSVVAEREGRVVGHLLFSPVTIVTSTTEVEALSLAPMAVHPDFQRQGIGAALLKRSLEMCHERGHQRVVVLGHPEFYARAGFSASLAEPLLSPFGGGPAWMALELQPGSWQGIAGTVKYPPPFDVFL